MFWRYSQQVNVSIWIVPFKIPIKCNIGCAALLVFQLYWLVVMIKIAVKTIRKDHIAEIKNQPVKNTSDYSDVKDTGDKSHVQ